MNNAWISDFRVWAHEARFDRFAKFDSVVRVSSSSVRYVEKDKEVRPVVITHVAGVKNVRVVGKKEELCGGKKGNKNMEGTVVVNVEEDKKLLVGTVEVQVAKKKVKLKKTRKGGVDGATNKKEEVSGEKGQLVVVGTHGKGKVSGNQSCTPVCWCIIRSRRIICGLKVVWLRH